MIASDLETAIDELQELVEGARVIAPFTGAVWWRADGARAVAVSVRPINGKPGERPPAPRSNSGLVPRTAHVGSDPVHQDRTKSRGLDQPQARTLYHRKLKSSPPSIKNLSAVVICASQTGCAKSGRYNRAGHYLITVPRVPLTPLRTAGFFFYSVLGPRGIGFCAVSGREGGPTKSLAPCSGLIVG